MTDYCKVRIIGDMISNCLEYTEHNKDSLDALVSCIDAVVQYDGGDYPPLAEGNESIMLGYSAGDLSKGVFKTESLVQS